MPSAGTLKMPHPHTGMLVSGALILGLLLGAAAGYYGGQFQLMMQQTAQQIQNSQAQNNQQAQDQTQADATASSYQDVNTNPVGDVQTNPFQ